jgi:hypothetical protein
MAEELSHLDNVGSFDIGDKRGRFKQVKHGIQMGQGTKVRCL